MFLLLLLKLERNKDMYLFPVCYFLYHGFIHVTAYRPNI